MNVKKYDLSGVLLLTISMPFIAIFLLFTGDIVSIGNLVKDLFEKA
jgi:hypothetical protein